MPKIKSLIAIIAVGLAFGLFWLPLAHPQTQLNRARDPGPRQGKAGAGGPLFGLTADEKEMFDVGRDDFLEEEEVDEGVGPRFNFVGCAGCHQQPAVGGTSPPVNPLLRVPADLGFSGNRMPSFITHDGQSERDETPSCQFATVPNDVVPSVRQISAIENFANFQRFLAPPAPSSDTPGGAASIGRGRARFTDVGCALCHTPTLRTGNSTVGALRDKPVNLFSDLVLHQMGPGLADDILQGEASGSEFRTAPLWGLGQRLFFLHDGRATDVQDAILAHRSSGNSKFGPSEANNSVDRYNQLRESDKQDLLNFLRSL